MQKKRATHQNKLEILNGHVDSDIMCGLFPTYSHYKWLTILSDATAYIYIIGC